MEVHHHTHSHGKKNWKTYFWEFLMLFLAVFCGFLAEYQLEHKIERDREKIYISNLLEDLKSDTAIYNEYGRTSKVFEGRIDSLMRLLRSPDRSAHLDQIYYYARVLTLNSNIAYPSQRTFTQMKNSGLLRLIRKQKVADNVSSYYLELDEILSQNDFILGMISDYWNEAGNLFDAEVLYRIRIERKMPDNKNLNLMTYDPVVINKFLVNAQYLYGSRMKQSEAVSLRFKSANELMTLIQKEYHLN
jgi:hypothetical protein